MRIVRILGKFLLAVCVIVIISAYILINHSTTQLSLTCNGEWRGGSNETVYAVLEEYRPWIFWGNSDGNFLIESKNQPMQKYVSDVSRIGREPLVSYFLLDHSGKMIGGYRGGPNEFTFAFTDTLVFSGICTEGI